MYSRMSAMCESWLEHLASSPGSFVGGEKSLVHPACACVKNHVAYAQNDVKRVGRVGL